MMPYILAQAVRPAGDWTDTADIIIKIIALIGTATGAIIALRTYQSTQRQRRYDFLERLYRQFYDEKAELNQIAEEIEGGSEFAAFIADFRAQNTTSEERFFTFDTRLTRFLNFFQFLGGMWKDKQISDMQLKATFSYPLTLIQRNPDLVTYLRIYHYDNVTALLKIVNPQVETRHRYIFFYGTLQGQSGTSKSKLVEQNLKRVGLGKTKGRLYHVGHDPETGEYPGLVPHTGMKEPPYVEGELWEIPDPDNTKFLKQLDEYEGASPDDKVKLYARRIRPVHVTRADPTLTDDEKNTLPEVVDAYVYVWLGTIREKPLIETGRWSDYNPSPEDRSDAFSRGQA